MDKLQPCPFCGESHALGDGEGDDNWFECMFCHARGPRTTFVDAMDTDADRDAWNRRTPADPALLALARLGAWALDHDDIYDSDRRAAGALMMDGCAPGDVSALAARLLAPDGAGEVADA